MSIVPVMWSVWGLVVLITIALYIYRSNLERDEEDQIFLDDSFAHEKNNQAAIVARVSRVQPILHGSMVVVAVATLFVIGYYIMDIVNQFK